MPMPLRFIKHLDSERYNQYLTPKYHSIRGFIVKGLRGFCYHLPMLDITYLRDNIETARERLHHRGFSLDVETFQRLDGERKTIILEVERLRQLRNTASDEIAKQLKEKIDVTAKRNEMKVVSQQIKEKEDALRAVEEQLFNFVAVIPNLADPDVPVGPTDEQ